MSLPDPIKLPEPNSHAVALDTLSGDGGRHVQEILDTLPAAIYMTDAEGRLTYFNNAAVEFSGHTPELGTDRWCVSWKLFRPDGTPLPHDQCPMAIALKEGRPLYGEEAIAERPDGSRRWFMAFPTPFRDKDGTVMAGINMLVDITERKEAEKTSNLLAAIVDSSDDAIISKNLDGYITSWNKAAERIFGYTSEEAVGQHITLIIPADRREEENEILARLRRGERIDHFETIRRRKNGALLNISLTVSPVRNAAGRVVGASKVARNITEQKRIQEALRDSEEKFRTIVETANDAIVLSDLNGIIVDFNRKAEQMFGYSRTEAIGKSLTLIMPERYQGPHLRGLERLRSTGETRMLGKTVELEGRRNDGTEFPLQFSLASWQTKDGVFFTGVIRDITERKRAEENYRKLAETLDAQVRERTKELQERNTDVIRQSEQLRELSWRLLQTQDDERRHIARELHDSAGQTLAVLSMNLTQLVQDAAAKAPELARQAEQAEHLVQQLHKEIRTTSYLLHPPLLDETGLALALAWYTDGLAQRSGLNIDLDIPEDFGRIPRAIELVVFRVIQECLTNVHRHSGANRTCIRVARVNGCIKVEVEDNGRGIPAAKLAEVQSGFGVGFRGMRERVRQFQGDMQIESSSSGTKVTVTIPVPKPDDQEESSEPLQAAV